MIKDIDFITVFKEIIENIKTNYLNYRFFTERDFEWTIQKYLWSYIDKNHLPFDVYNNHPFGQRTFVDLAIVKKGTPYRAISKSKATAELVVEFKFEPSIKRTDICKGKLDSPVVLWDEVIKDIDRVNRLIKDGKTKSAIAFFVDEYGRFRNRNISKQSKWDDWGNYGNELYNTSILWTIAEYLT